MKAHSPPRDIAQTLQLYCISTAATAPTLGWKHSSLLTEIQHSKSILLLKAGVCLHFLAMITCFIFSHILVQLKLQLLQSHVWLLWLWSFTKQVTTRMGNPGWSVEELVKRCLNLVTDSVIKEKQRELP